MKRVVVESRRFVQANTPRRHVTEGMEWRDAGRLGGPAFGRCIPLLGLVLPLSLPRAGVDETNHGHVAMRCPAGLMKATLAKCRQRSLIVRLDQGMNALNPGLFQKHSTCRQEHCRCNALLTKSGMQPEKPQRQEYPAARGLSLCPESAHSRTVHRCETPCKTARLPKDALQTSCNACSSLQDRSGTTWL